MSGQNWPANQQPDVPLTGLPRPNNDSGPLRLRQWQREALDSYLARAPRDFLAVATPGAGKTTFALAVATELLRAKTVSRVHVVCPTEHLKYQWADAAARVGIQIDPAFANAQVAPGPQYRGVAVTYAQVAANPAVHAALVAQGPTLVIIDEIHHGGDALSWGEGLRLAYGGATRRLALTGTPFRSDTAPIPYVTYVRDSSGVRRSHADYTYGYGQALADGVVRPVLFMSYTGQMQWRTGSGVEFSAELSQPMTKAMAAAAWRTALNPTGEWIAAVLRAADQRLTEMRRTVPDAGGLVIATNKAHARAYAELLHEITGRYPTVVLSDERGASESIENFAAGDQRWMVAVRMVSEGVDVPRLAVGVYATVTSTPLFFAQAVGRFVRTRRRGETASIFLPSVPWLLNLAAEIEASRDHALDLPDTEPDLLDDAELDAANRAERASSELEGDKFEALASQAAFDMVLYEGGEFGAEAEVGSVEELDFLGIPGLLDADQVQDLLRQRQAQQLKNQARTKQAAQDRRQNSGLSDHRVRAAKRKELNKLVAGWSTRTGKPHPVIHAELRRVCGGPEVAASTTEQIEARIDKLRHWFVGLK